jgi:acyl carrier protein
MNEIYDWVTNVLKQQFQIPEEELRPDVHLFDDLDLDSIDAIDLAVRLEEKTGLSLKEENLKEMQTIQDVVNFLHERL